MSAKLIVAFEKLALLINAPLNVAFVKSAPVKFDPPRNAFVRSAPTQFVRVTLESEMTAFLRFAPRSWTWVRSLLTNLAKVKS
jgi:hypothetical protein